MKKILSLSILCITNTVCGKAIKHRLKWWAKTNQYEWETRQTADIQIERVQTTKKTKTPLIIKARRADFTNAIEPLLFCVFFFSHPSEGPAYQRCLLITKVTQEQSPTWMGWQKRAQRERQEFMCRKYITTTSMKHLTTRARTSRRFLAGI